MARVALGERGKWRSEMHQSVLLVGLMGISGATLSVPAFAEGDIGLMVSGSQMLTTKVSEEGLALGSERVFSGAFSLISGTWYTDEPGLQIASGTLQPGSSLGMYFTRALRQWNGSNFDLVSGGRLSATFGPASNSIWTPLTDLNTASVIFPVAGSGGMHDHPDWVLENFDPGSDAFFFLAEARFSSNQGGLSDSLPFYIVFGLNADESEVEAMEGWVRANLVPAPSGASLLIGMSIVSSRRRRRTRCTLGQVRT